MKMDTWNLGDAGDTILGAKRERERIVHTVGI